MGGLSLAQGAWDQNSLARANNSAQWNQVLMTALMTAKLFNQRGVNMLGGSSSAANILTFFPSKPLHHPTTIPDNNAIVMPIVGEKRRSGRSSLQAPAFVAALVAAGGASRCR